MEELRTYDTAQQAYIVCGMLEANGVHCTVSTDAMETVFPAPGSGTGAATVYVDASQRAEAESLLAEHGD